MIILVVFQLAISSKFAEFKFWQNYGQVLFDTSLNSRHAINGMSHKSIDRDCLYTDRGFYLSNQKSHIRLPQNTYVPVIEHVSTPYKVVFWFHNTFGSGRYGFRWTPSIYWILDLDTSNHFLLSYKSSQAQSSTLSLEPYNVKGSWILYGIHVKSNNIKVLFNEVVAIDQTFQGVYQETDSMLTCGVGSDSASLSVKGFIWYYAILVDEESSQFIHQGVSTTCLSGSSCSCNPVIKIDSDIGCVSTISDLSVNSKERLVCILNAQEEY